MNPEPTLSGWFAVRCLFRTGWGGTGASPGVNRYEERITLWRAASADEALARAESEAVEYAATIEEAPDEYLGLAQSYALFDNPTTDGAEVFSLIRDSNLDPATYLNVFFDTGDEHLEGNQHSGSNLS